jgi:hypothetical protein
LDLNRLWVGTSLIVVGTVLVASIMTGKTLNPMRGLSPPIVSRSENPRRYWGGVFGFVAVFLIWGWLAFKVVTMAT